MRSRTPGRYVGSGPALSDSESDQEEEDASEQEDEDDDVAFEVGDTVSVYVEGEDDAPEGSESTSLARLCEKRANSWLVYPPPHHHGTLGIVLL